jgi:plastocyanin
LVHRQLTGGLGALAIALAIALVATLLPTAADAANRRISISNYRWSDTEIQIDRGEHVSWYWVGPDTMHSVTGDNAAAAGLDSDPQTNQPQHQVGDTFQLDFDEPGRYEFRCKLHSTVRGSITVSEAPGDPDSEPDPVPESNVDLSPPKLSNVFLTRNRIFRKGTSMKYSLDERARIEIEYYLLRKGKRRKFAGWARYKWGHTGFNRLRFGIRRKRFKAKPGRYLAKVRAIDEAANETRPTKLRFRIIHRRRR